MLMPYDEIKYGRLMVELFEIGVRREVLFVDCPSWRRLIEVVTVSPKRNSTLA